MPYLDTTGLDALWSKVKTAITTAVNGKQDKLTAGDNVTISDNVISAEDTTYPLVSGKENGIVKLISGDMHDTSELDGFGTFYGVPAGHYSITGYLDSDTAEWIPLTGDYVFAIHKNKAASLSKWLDTLDDGKQDKLTAGANITISNNVISATASGTGIGYKVYNGTTVVQFKNDSSYGYIAPMFSKSEMKAIIGRDWDDEKDVMLCMNGDWNAQPNLSGLTASHADSGNSHTSYKNFFCTAAYASTGAVRINYVIIAKES